MDSLNNINWWIRLKKCHIAIVEYILSCHAYEQEEHDNV